MAENLSWHKFEHLSLFHICEVPSVSEVVKPFSFLDKLTVYCFYSKPKKRRPSGVEIYYRLTTLWSDHLSYEE